MTQKDLWLTNNLIDWWFYPLSIKWKSKQKIKINENINVQYFYWLDFIEMFDHQKALST